MAQEKLIARSRAQRNAADYALAGAQSLPDQTLDGGRGMMHLPCFFQAYGERSGVMWQAFDAGVVEAAAVEFAAAAGTQDEVVGAAILTFRTRREWCKGRPAHA